MSNWLKYCHCNNIFVHLLIRLILNKVRENDVLFVFCNSNNYFL